MRLVAIKWTMFSLSDVDWKIQPRFTKGAHGVVIGQVAVMGDGEAAEFEIGE